VAGLIDPAGRQDAGAFLTRLLRLDGAAVVRLRPAPGGSGVAIWARLPFGVLVTRGLRATVDHDVTVRAEALLAAITADSAELPAPVDVAWRWPLPPGPGVAVEALPAAEVRRVAAAAAEAVRAALGPTAPVGLAGVGNRRIRDAMLDHVPIVVESGPQRFEISQRLVQGLARMGFLGDDPVTVRSIGGWLGLSARHGTCWYRTIGGTVAVRIAPLPA
jgi:hypothetical protein